MNENSIHSLFENRLTILEEEINGNAVTGRPSLRKHIDKRISNLQRIAWFFGTTTLGLILSSFFLRP